jgi:hypothetical protein
LENVGRIFKEVWEKCKAHEGYQRLKEEFLKEQKEWENTFKEEQRNELNSESKTEQAEDGPIRKKRKTKQKNQDRKR